MDVIRRKILQYSNVIIFGYADIGKKIYNMICSTDENILRDRTILFCDNSTVKRQEYPDLILSLSEAVERSNPETVFITASIYHSKQMKEQLIQHGIIENQIITDIPKVIVDEEMEKERNKKCVPMQKLQFEVAIVRHCNLRCKGCDHFAPVAKERYMPVDIYERDAKRLSELFSGECEYIMLLGGEPLLHPDITSFMEISRRYFPSTRISIVTNGLLVKSRPEFFWEACKMYDIEIMVTEYPVNIDYAAMGEMVRAKGVKFCYEGSSEGGRSLWKFPLDLAGKQNAMDSFTNCRNANSCLTLDNGRIYTCSIAPNIDDFSAYFNKDISLMDADGVDIHKAGMTSEFILQRMAAPMPFCRYCDVKRRTFDHPWERSKLDINEWT